MKFLLTPSLSSPFGKTEGGIYGNHSGGGTARVLASEGRTGHSVGSEQASWLYSMKQPAILETYPNVLLVSALVTNKRVVYAWHLMYPHADLGASGGPG